MLLNWIAIVDPKINGLPEMVAQVYHASTQTVEAEQWKHQALGSMGRSRPA